MGNGGLSPGQVLALLGYCQGEGVGVWKPLVRTATLAYTHHHYFSLYSSGTVSELQQLGLQHKAERCVLGLGSHCRHLAVTQQWQTHSLGSYCLIIANWQGFGHLESPWTCTIRFGQKGSPGTGTLPVTSAALLC